MKFNTASRDFIYQQLKGEIIGPTPAGSEIDFRNQIIFKDKTDSFKMYRQQGSGEEIIQRDSPLTRYGAGILHAPPSAPAKKPKEVADLLKKIVFDDEANIILRETRDTVTNGDNAQNPAGNRENILQPLKIDANLPDLSSAQKFLPNSMAFTFQAEIDRKSQLIVDFNGGHYIETPIKVEKETRLWLGREPIKITAKFNNLEFISQPRKLKPSKIESENVGNLNLAVEAFIRPTNRKNIFTITVIVSNRSEIPTGKMPDAYAVFQSELAARVVSPIGNRHIVAYEEEDRSFKDLSVEEQSIELLYRQKKIYAVGHGCAPNWNNLPPLDSKIIEVTADHFPAFEIPQISSEIKGKNGKKIEISMRKLAGLTPGDDGMADLKMLVDGYADWISEQESKIENLSFNYAQTAIRHLNECREALERMRDGLQLLSENETVRRAFQLTNRAMLAQQLRSKQALRETRLDFKTSEPWFSRKYLPPNLLDHDDKLGLWRAFQIGCLLQSLRSTIDPHGTERTQVDLIWYPTGGGKSEAYLALTSFTIFYRRLINPSDNGCISFMRYTLRLLTAQQFQRSAALICEMELLRRENPEQLGLTPISIGLWLGNDVTPGNRHDARRNLEQLVKNPRWTENKFILNRCPSCGAEMGKVEYRDSNKKSSSSRTEKRIGIAGYRQKSGTVILHCPDNTCEFYDELPIYVIDEQIYQKHPTFFIATSDKFAVLAWKPEARALFGLDSNGQRISPPPSLIKQDELQLISGPLGTMVGLNEALIEELCTDYSIPEKPVKPKIIAATATTRGYKDQVLALFGRAETRLFPPPGLDADDSYFAQPARDADGKLLPGRLYVGISAPGLGSVQNAEVRTYASLLQSGSQLPLDERNHYWTLMIFFNSLKTLGNTVSLFQSNVRQYALTLFNRIQGKAKQRRVKNPLELTGQLRGDEVLDALKKLEINWTATSNRAIDVCLCSSLAEVGVDVSRLSMMVVNGQPKSNSQYIQVTSRVGRNSAYPGLIVTIFNPFNDRDRSHFERFRPYHERLYAGVEPNSLTPFSNAALERALHAVIVAYVRQTGNQRAALRPNQVPDEKIVRIREILLARVQKIAPEMIPDFERIFDRRIGEWRLWDHTAWSHDPRDGDRDTEALLRSVDRWVDERTKSRSWATPVSMRSVDTESTLAITDFYSQISLLDTVNELSIDGGDDSPEKLKEK